MIPDSVVVALGLRARMRVSGRIDGAPFRSTLMPRGGGRLFVVVPATLRERIGKTAGQTVQIAVTPDLKPVVLRVPKDFLEALGTARPAFDRLAPSHRKAFLQWINSAKQPATRERRIANAVAMVGRGDTLH
jgi:bifunctional DNA-binding transcriptional regulator/antitoxin component of YhaV-PrlF toxin-antitoxin module